MKTKYNGTVQCQECKKSLTPFQALYGKTCPRCRADNAVKLIKNGMVQ